MVRNFQRKILDYHHIYPEYSNLIINKIMAKDESNLPKDFGKVLTKENLEAYLKDLN